MSMTDIVPNSTAPVARIENRGATRRRVLKQATLGFGGPGLDCTVRDISRSGAALIVDAESRLPPEFMLAVVSLNFVSKCRIVWRAEDRLGVAFV